MKIDNRKNQVSLTDYPTKSHFFHANTLILIFFCCYSADHDIKNTKKNAKLYIFLACFNHAYTHSDTFCRGRAFTSKQILLFSVSVWNYLSRRKRVRRVTKKKEKKRNEKKKNETTNVYTTVSLRAQRPKFDIHMGIRNVDNKFSCLVLLCQWNGFAIVLKWTQCFPAIWIDLCFFLRYIWCNLNELKRDNRLIWNMKFWNFGFFFQMFSIHFPLFSISNKLAKRFVFRCIRLKRTLNLWTKKKLPKNNTNRIKSTELY